MHKTMSIIGSCGGYPTVATIPFLVVLLVHLPTSFSSSSSSIFSVSLKSSSNDLQQRKKSFYSTSSNAAFVVGLGTSFSKKKVPAKEGNRFQVCHSPTFYHPDRIDSKRFTLADNDSTTTATAAMSATVTTTADLYPGGEYAGVYSTHSSLTGKLIPVPDHYVPDAMKEWDMIPAYFEFLFSDQNNEDEDEIIVKRRTATILPEVGCGVDNLDVVSNVDTTKLEHKGKDDGKNGGGEEGRGSIHMFGQEDEGKKIITFDKVSSFLYRNKKDLLRKNIETIFHYSPTLHGDNDGDDDEEGKTQHRVRVTFDILPTEGALHDKITLSVERPFPNDYDKKRSVADLVDGGGLDGRTVSRLIGSDTLDYAKTLHDEEEGDIEGKLTIQDLIGRWKRLDGMEKDGEVDRTVDNSKTTTTLFLPGNVIIQYGSKQDEDKCWQVEVSRVLVSKLNPRIQRVVIRRVYDMKDGTLISENGSPEYFVEEKIQR